MPEHVRIIARTRDWLRYEVPDHYIRRDARGHYKGQKQIWFLLQLIGRDWDLNLRATDHPEFDAWRWNDYWVPLDVVIEFKRGVYEMALTELARFLPRCTTTTATCARACAAAPHDDSLHEPRRTASATCRLPAAAASTHCAPSCRACSVSAPGWSRWIISGSAM